MSSLTLQTGFNSFDDRLSWGNILKCDGKYWCKSHQYVFFPSLPLYAHDDTIHINVCVGVGMLQWDAGNVSNKTLVTWLPLPSYLFYQRSILSFQFHYPVELMVLENLMIHWRKRRMTRCQPQRCHPLFIEGGEQEQSWGYLGLDENRMDFWLLTSSLSMGLGNTITVKDIFLIQIM